MSTSGLKMMVNFWYYVYLNVTDNFYYMLDMLARLPFMGCFLLFYAFKQYYCNYYYNYKDYEEG